MSDLKHRSAAKLDQKAVETLGLAYFTAEPGKPAPAPAPLTALEQMYGYFAG